MSNNSNGAKSASSGSGQGSGQGSVSALEYLTQTVGVALKGLDMEKDTKVFQDTEAAMAKFFNRYLCGDSASGLVYWNADGTISVYDGRVYVRKKAESVKHMIKSVMQSASVNEVYVTNSINKIYQRCMIDIEHGFEFMPDRRYAVFNNCVLDFRSGELHEFSSEYKTDIVFDFDYDSEARSALWDNFILQTIPSDDMRLAFQMFCGAFFVDRREVKIELACYLIGNGRNGKSVAVKAISDTLGSDMVSFFSPQQLFTETTCMYNRANADGKLANFSDDVKATDYSGGDFKQFVSGMPFEARRIRQEPYTMRSVPFMVLCVNAMPPTTDDTNGHYRRVLPIVCPNTVAEKDVDPFLESKLRATECRQAIFNWMYEGYRKLMANGGKIPKGKNIVEVQEELKSDSNSARRWIRDVGYQPCNSQFEDKDKWMPFKQMMEDYRKYCTDMAEPVKSQKSVGMILRELGFKSERIGGALCYCVNQSFGDGQTEDMPF